MSFFCINQYIHETAKRIGVYTTSPHDNVPSPGAFRRISSPVTSMFTKKKKKKKERKERRD
jgi:hypothetical protein